MKPGLYDIAASAYHADNGTFQGTEPVPPSLSASIANILLTRSPLHAWTAHPRLNPNWEPEVDDKFDIGTVVHALLLQGLNVMEVLAFPDFKSNAAKEARDAARANGRIPILTKHAKRVEEMCNAVAPQLEAFDVDPIPLTNGKPEQTIVWQDAQYGVWCRGRIDWLHDNLSAIDDLKTTTRSAHPEAFAKNLYSYGCDVQAAFYLRGIQALKGSAVSGMMDWRWVVVETSPPYGLSVIEPGPAVLELADAKVDAALKLWADCLERDSWPGYPTRVATAELPAWEEARWLQREEIGS
jgi:hypothetical protein